MKPSSELFSSQTHAYLFSLSCRPLLSRRGSLPSPQWLLLFFFKKKFLKMFSSRLASLTIITLVASALADFKITSPGPDNWWGKYPVKAFLPSYPNLTHYVPKLPIPRTLFRGLAVITPRVPQMDNICSCGCCFIFLLVGIFSPTLRRLQIEQHRPQSLSGAGRYSRKYSQCRLLGIDQRRASERYSRGDWIYRYARRYG